MTASDKDVIADRNRRPPVRQPGWVALLLVLAVAFLMIGGVLLGMMQAPAFSRKLVAVGWACLTVGLLLIPIAWAGWRKNV